jgi:hypothetical protein
MNWTSADEHLKQLHREMCATIAIVIRASLERDSRIAEQVKKGAALFFSCFFSEAARSSWLAAPFQRGG